MLPSSEALDKPLHLDGASPVSVCLQSVSLEPVSTALTSPTLPFVRVTAQFMELFVSVFSFFNVSCVSLKNV